ncbi:hypothetical protein V6N13_092750 [Hibiscus sabdariffa]
MPSFSKYAKLCCSEFSFSLRYLCPTLTPGAKAPSKTAGAEDISPPADCFFSISNYHEFQIQPSRSKGRDFTWESWSHSP